MSPQPPEVVAGNRLCSRGSGSVKIEIRGNTSRSEEAGSGVGGCLDSPSSTGGCNGNLGACCSPGLWKDKFSLAKERVSRCRRGRLFFLFPHKEGGGRKESRKKGEIDTRVKLAQRAKFKTETKPWSPPVLAAKGPLSRAAPASWSPVSPPERNSILCFIKHLFKGKGHGFSLSTCVEAEHVAEKEE